MNKKYNSKVFKNIDNFSSPAYFTNEVLTDIVDDYNDQLEVIAKLDDTKTNILSSFNDISKKIDEIDLYISKDINSINFDEITSKMNVFFDLTDENSIKSKIKDIYKSLAEKLNLSKITATFKGTSSWSGGWYAQKFLPDNFDYSQISFIIFDDDVIINPTSNTHYIDFTKEFNTVEFYMKPGFTSLSYMFERPLNCVCWYESVDLSECDTSNVTDMSYMFRDLHLYQYGSLGKDSAVHLKLVILNCDTTKVTDMKYMFTSCAYLNDIVLNGFNTTNVTDMSYMFYRCNNLTSLDVSNWNTSNVTNMYWMFYDCRNLTSLDVSNWDTSYVTNMSNMFYGCSSLISLDVSKWNTSNVTNMNYTFSDCSGLASLEVSNFDTSNVTNMDSMFSHCYNLTSLEVSNFDTSNVTDMNRMFYGCSGLASLDLSNWDTSNVTNMNCMFYGCINLSSIKLGLSFILSKPHQNQNCLNNIFGAGSSSYIGYNTRGSNILYIPEQTTFYQSDIWLDTLLNSNKCGFNIERYEYTQPETIKSSENKITAIYDVTSVNSPTLILGDYFVESYSGPIMYIDGVQLKNGVRMLSLYTFNSTGKHVVDIVGVNTSMDRMFYGCTNLTLVDFSNLDMSIFTNISYMFYSCTKLTSLDVSNWDTSNITNTSHMFDNCVSLTSLDVSNWDTSKVTVMNSMFEFCNNLTSLDVSNWDTSKVTNMSWMFYHCSKLNSLDTSNFDTSNVANINGMFRDCPYLTSLNLTKLNNNILTSLSSVFGNCRKLYDIKLNLTNVKDSNIIVDDCFTDVGVDIQDQAKILHVPIGAVGYDLGEWLELLNTNGFQIVYDL